MSNSTDNGNNLYRPYVDFSTTNPALLNPYLPSGNFDASSAFELNAGGGVNSSNSVAKDLATYALMKYLTTALATPFEVAQTLLQVQHIPLNHPTSHREKQGEESESDDEFDESDDEGYLKPKAQESLNDQTVLERGDKVATDRLGYVVESTGTEATRPPHQLPTLKGGIWATLGALIKHPNEGIFSLWKGQFTYWLNDMAHLFLQPTLEGALNDTFDLYDDTIPLVHLDSVGPNIATILVSHLVVGLVLNPLEVVRTRLTVQSADPNLAKYNGPFHALAAITQEEGWETLFWGRDIVPTMLYHVINPLFHHCTPLIIDRWLHLSLADSPFMFGLAELTFNTLQLLITLPLDTIRKRLHIQLQTRTPPPRPFISVVRVRNAPYGGPLDCAYRIATEEAFPDSGNAKLRGASYYTAHGLGALYRGFGFHSTSNLLTSVVSGVTGITDDGDW